ncbi:MAG: hypothetical protein D6808_07935, partial [Candidatus Dadabacteria bacterium]
TERFRDLESDGILLVLSLLAFLSSVALFVISKYGIGVLCPLCVGVYSVNVATFLLAFFFGKGGLIGRFFEGIRSAVMLAFESIGFLGAKRGSQVRLLALYVLISAAFALVLPRHFSMQYIEGLEGEDTSWESAPQQDLNIDLGEGKNRDYFLGKKGAPVTIVEFADFECPACKRFSHVLEKVLRDHGKDILYVFKNYPLDNACNPAIKKRFHEYGCYGAYLARCAGAQGKFWDMVHYLFSIDPMLSGTPLKREMERGISTLGLDREALSQCMASSDVRNKIRLDIKEGDRLGVDGTPALWINGRRFRSLSYQSLENLVRKLIGNG